MNTTGIRALDATTFDAIRGSTRDGDERRAEAEARALLGFLSEPGDVVLGRAVAAVGAQATVDLIVQLSMQTAATGEVARRERRVAEIVALSPGEREVGYATTHVFRPDASGTARPDVLPDEYRELAKYGFDLGAFLASNPFGPTS